MLSAYHSFAGHLRDIPNTSTAVPVRVVPSAGPSNKGMLHHYWSVETGFVNRVWTFLKNLLFLPLTTNRTSLIYCPVGHRRVFLSQDRTIIGPYSQAVFDWSYKCFLCSGSYQSVIVALQSRGVKWRSSSTPAQEPW